MPTIQGDSKLQIVERPAFNIFYVTINQTVKPFDKLEVRQAVAYGLDRQGRGRQLLRRLGQVAKEFMPPTLSGYADDVTGVHVRPGEGEGVAAEGGRDDAPVQVDFWYPTDVSRPYMPDPKRNFEAFAASLNKSGFKVVPHSAPWSPDYLGRVLAGTGGALNFLGQTGDYADADNFIGIFFQGQKPQWGFNNPALTQGARRGGGPARRRQARDRVPGDQPDDYGLPARDPGRALQVGARVRLEHQGLRPEPDDERVLREGLDRELGRSRSGGRCESPAAQRLSNGRTRLQINSTPASVVRP